MSANVATVETSLCLANVQRLAVEGGGQPELCPRAVVAVEGADARPFLQGLVSNDVDRLDAIISNALDGTIRSWNRGAEVTTGYRVDEILGSHFSIFYPPEDIAAGKPERELKDAARQGSVEDEGWRIRKDGTRFWANVVITTLRTSDGRLIGFTKVTRDLTERRQNEEALRWSEQRLEQAYLELAQKNSDLQDFTHVASHDLREPLRKIRTFAELLEQEHRESLDEEGRMYVDRIRASAERMATLIEDLLAYSRVTMRPQPFERVDLNRVIEEVTSDLQILLDETGGRVEPGLLPAVEADPTQMRQLFQNLIANALKFHRPGVAPLVRITLGSDAPTDAPDAAEVYTILVEDNGIGFDEKFAREIFAPFHRLHSRQYYEGSGLGLSISKRIVERHGGSISARSRPGHGTTFTVCLPVRQSRATRR